jgi:hypothetical protein
MDKKISFPLDGISLQHAGELLIDFTPTLSERKICGKTYIRCLEDFCFAYTYGSHFAHTGKFPEIEGRKPGRELCDKFFEKFEELDDKGYPNVEAFLNDVEKLRYLSDDMMFAYKAFKSSPVFYRDWIVREATAHLGADSTIFKDVYPPNLYIFKKTPPYLKAREFQHLIPDEFIKEMSKTILATGKYSTVHPNAIKEFVSRSYLTHQVLFWWYNNLVRKKDKNYYIQMPHITRLLLRSTVQANSKEKMYNILQEVLVRPSLMDALLISTDRYNLADNLKKISNDPPYPKLRDRIKNIFEEMDEKKGERGVQTLIKEINNYSRSRSIIDIIENFFFSIPTPTWIPSPGLTVDSALFFPHKFALRKIIKQYKAPEYYLHLSRIFKELDINSF